MSTAPSLMALPSELLDQVLLNCPPSALLILARTCSALHSHLYARSSEPIWKAARTREGFALLDAAPPGSRLPAAEGGEDDAGWTEILFARLLTNECMVCATSPAPASYRALGTLTRLCATCSGACLREAADVHTMMNRAGGVRREDWEQWDRTPPTRQKEAAAGAGAGLKTLMASLSLRKGAKEHDKVYPTSQFIDLCAQAPIWQDGPRPIYMPDLTRFLLSAEKRGIHPIALITRFHHFSRSVLKAAKARRAAMLRVLDGELKTLGIESWDWIWFISNVVYGSVELDLLPSEQDLRDALERARGKGNPYFPPGGGPWSQAHQRVMAAEAEHEQAVLPPP